MATPKLIADPSRLPDNRVEPGLGGKLEGPQRDAFEALKALFKGFGLESLAPKIFEYVKQGYGADTIALLLAETPEYKERFAGNELRRKAGLPVLAPAEYLAVEQSYRQILQDAGMPKGYYDSPSDFSNWIGGDVSPTEVKSRTDLAVANTAMASPQAKQAMNLLYGIDESLVTAYFFDRTRAVPLLQKQATAVQFGAEGLKRGLALDRTRLEEYATSGLSLSTISQGFQQVAEELPNLEAIAQRFGSTFTQGEAESAAFYGAGADRKRKGLASQERALFGGSRGSSSSGLSAGYRAT